MRNDIIAIKGLAEGMLLEVKGNDIEALKSSLNTKIKSSGEFFMGSKFLDIRGEELSAENRLELMMLLKYKYDFMVDIPSLNEQDENRGRLKQSTSKGQSFEGVDEGIAKFVHGTLRSGQEVSFNGNIVVIGDVNPGAQLKAKGNIVVLGSLKGAAYAGIGGNTNAIVAAYSLLPTQLRIADFIVRPPEGDVQYKYPEIARVTDGEVVIEPYLPNK